MQINNKILLRSDFNEPIKNDELMSTKRIDANLNTIFELLTKKNKLVLISHHSDKGQTLAPAYVYIKKILEQALPKISLIYLNSTDENVVSEYFIQNKNNLPDVILIENTRLFLNKETEKSKDEANDLRFAKFLSSLADAFVYDAFSVGHRNHASTTGVAKLLPSSFGNTFLTEYNNLSKLGEESAETLIIMGGAKLSTKLPIIEKFLNAGSTVCVGGAMAHPILKLKGIDIKNSFTEEGVLLSNDTCTHKNIILPSELIWNKGDEENSDTKIVDDIFDTDYLEKLVREKNIKNILWNGPVGMYESGGVKGSDKIKNFLEKMGRENINTVIGGGDTLTYLEAYPDFTASYISLSGGAMLTFLSDGTLPILKEISINIQ
jgi:phosphoglycerate kinase